VLELEGRYPLPDDRSRGLPSAPEPVYAVRFAAAELFGAGGHQVTLALWESYLRPLPGAGHEEAGRDE
jgi:nitrile hydratase